MMARNTSTTGKTQVKGKNKRGAHLPVVGKATQFKPNNPITGEKDPRINRAGYVIPKDVKELNEEIAKVFAEEVSDRSGNKMSKIRASINQLLLNKNPSGATYIHDRYFGKIPNVNLNTNQNIDIVSKFKDKLTDSELEAISNGADALEILLKKLPTINEE